MALDFVFACWVECVGGEVGLGEAEKSIKSLKAEVLS